MERTYAGSAAVGGAIDAVRRVAGLLGEDQLVVAGVAQAVTLVTVTDQQLALSLQQALFPYAEAL